MKELTVENFKKEIEKQTLIKIDFRTHAHILNSIGATPICDYYLMRNIVTCICNVGNDLGGNYDVDTSLESLRTTTLKSFIEDVVFSLNNQYN